MTEQEVVVFLLNLKLGQLDQMVRKLNPQIRQKCSNYSKLWLLRRWLLKRRPTLLAEVQETASLAARVPPPKRKSVVKPGRDVFSDEYIEAELAALLK